MVAIRLIGRSAERLLADSLVELNVLDESIEALVLALCADIAQYDHSHMLAVKVGRVWVQNVHFKRLVLSLKVRIATDAHDHRVHMQLVIMALRRIVKMHLRVPKVHAGVGQLVLGIIDGVINGFHRQVGRRTVELLAPASKPVLYIAAKVHREGRLRLVTATHRRSCHANRQRRTTTCVGVTSRDIIGRPDDLETPRVGWD